MYVRRESPAGFYVLIGGKVPGPRDFLRAILD